MDDLVHQNFGENSYVYIPGKIISSSEQAKKKESVKMFNRAESEQFICLFEYHAHHSSIRLSHVNVVILFNSDLNPSNDIKTIKRFTIDSSCERLKVVRLYSIFTIEEKALILAKQGTTVNTVNPVKSSVCHWLLAWGASYLFSKVQTCTDNGPLSFIDDVVDELSPLLSNTRVKTGPKTRSFVSKAVMENEAYSGSILLFGESESHTKENYAVEDYLIDNSPSVFWNNLVKEIQDRPGNACNRLSRRVRKSPRTLFDDGYQDDATTKPKSKSKVAEKVGKKRGMTIIKRYNFRHIINFINQL